MALSHRLPLLAVRTATLLAGCALVCRATWSLVRNPLVAAFAAVPGGSLSLETALVGGCAVMLLACVAWGGALTVLSVLGLLAGELAPGRSGALRLLRRAERRCPWLLRRLAAAALGLTLGAGAALPAMATVRQPPAPGPLTGLQLPDRPTGAGLVATERASIAGPSTRPSQPRFVEVHPGDSLWRIARSLLPAGATDADITRAWHRLDRLNAERIGDDPDLIRPGTRLAVSVVDPSHRKDPA